MPIQTIINPWFLSLTVVTIPAAFVLFWSPLDWFMRLGHKLRGRKRNCGEVNNNWIQAHQNDRDSFSVTGLLFSTAVELIRYHCSLILQTSLLGRGAYKFTVSIVPVLLICLSIRLICYSYFNHNRFILTWFSPPKKSGY